MLVMIDSKGDSIAGILLSTKPVETIIVQIYMPTSDCEENVSLAFYEDIEEVMKRLGGRKDRVVVVMGDFNSVIGESQVKEIVGPFSIGETNDKGQLLIDYCKEKCFTIRSTQYQTAKKRRYTWTHPNGINKILIDYMLMDKKHRNSLCKCRPITNLDCGTDHNMVVGTLKIQRAKQQKKTKPQPKLNVQKLIYNEIRIRYKEIVDGKMRNAETWEEIKTGVLEAAKETLGSKKSEAKKTWMTEEILHLIVERDKLKKQSNLQRYRELKTEIQRKCREEKDKLIKVECENIEDLEIRNNSKELRQRIKKLNNRPRIQSNKSLLSKNGTILRTDIEQVKRWKEYIEEMYNGDRVLKMEEKETLEEEEIGREEIIKAIKSLRNNKAGGPDQIPIELIKNGSDNLQEKVIRIVKRTFETGRLNQDFVNSEITTIPKKDNTTKCEEHRTIALTSHVMKILLKAIPAE